MSRTILENGERCVARLLVGLFDVVAFAPVLKLLQVDQRMRRKTCLWQIYILVSLFGFRRFCTCSRVCSNRREVKDGLRVSLFKFSKSWTGTRSARFEDDGPAPRSGVGMMSAVFSVDEAKDFSSSRDEPTGLEGDDRRERREWKGFL